MPSEARGFRFIPSLECNFPLIHLKIGIVANVGKVMGFRK